MLLRGGAAPRVTVMQEFLEVYAFKSYKYPAVVHIICAASCIRFTTEYGGNLQLLP